MKYKTTYKDGTYIIWDHERDAELDAYYAQNEPDWLSTEKLN